MTTKITLANGTILEYDGDVTVGSDGSLLLEGKTSSTANDIPTPVSDVSAESDLELGSVQTEEDLIGCILKPEIGQFNKLKLVDSMLNITEVHFAALEALCRSEAFRSTSKSWRPDQLVSAFGWSDGAAKSRVANLVSAGLVVRAKWGEYALAYGVCDALYEYRSELMVERERRHAFVLGAYDPQRKKDL